MVKDQKEPPALSANKKLSQSKTPGKSSYKIEDGPKSSKIGSKRFNYEEWMILIYTFIYKTYIKILYIINIYIIINYNKWSLIINSANLIII